MVKGPVWSTPSCRDKDRLTPVSRIMPLPAVLLVPEEQPPTVIHLMYCPDNLHTHGLLSYVHTITEQWVPSCFLPALCCAQKLTPFGAV